jgi:mono/diheme cytochrome c family protein
MNSVSVRHALAVCLLALFVMTVVFAFGCTRNSPSQRPPVHLVPDMDSQEKHRPQSASRFFEDGSAQRVPVEGTVPLGYLQEDAAYYKGLNSRGEFVVDIPVDITMPLLKRGRERFEIYCSPCHSRVGDGRGIMIEKGYPPPPAFHTDRIRQLPDGQTFDVIGNGVRNMPSYRRQVPVDDRWAIVAYLRALQRSQNASFDDVPQERREALREVR